MQGFSELVQLSLIDWQIRSTQNEIDTLDDGRACKKELEVINQKLSLALAKKKQISSLLDDLKFKYDKALAEKKKMETQLFSQVVSPKTISEIQTRLASINSHIDEVETGQLEAMEAFEKITASCDKLQAMSDQKTQELETITQKFKNMTVKGQIKLKELGLERDSIRKVIDPSLLTKYDRLAEQKMGLAMVEVINNLCTGCQQPISITLCDSIKSEPEEIHYCNNCGRMVFIRRTQI